MQTNIHIILIFSCSISLGLTSLCQSDRPTLDDLLRTIENLQEPEEIPDYSPPFGWAKRRGGYQSDARINLIGNPLESFLRDLLYCYDNNNFATAWITTSLLEAFAYGKAPQPSQEQILLGVDVVNSYRDKNYPAGSAINSFWPQVLNQTSGYWASSPENFMGFINFVNNSVPWNVVDKILNFLDLKELAVQLELIRFLLVDATAAFHIPGDFDSSSLNLGLGGLLTELEMAYPAAYKSWMSNNTQLEHLTSALKKYAYRPFVEDINSNLIDPRSYFYLHEFLEEAQSKHQIVSLVPTWIHNLEATLVQYPTVVMPFAVNNIDINVAANFLFGITKAILEDLGNVTSWFDQDVQTIYMNTSSLIAWSIDTEIVNKRRDLALLYYPSIYSCYWFSSRSLFQLESRLANEGHLPHLALEYTYKTLAKVLRTKGTEQILSRGTSDPDGGIYFDDFLGDGDSTFFNKSKIHGEDRLFSTSVAINSLLSMWTIFNRTTHSLNWITGTPENVSHTVTKSVQFLEKYILSKKYKPFNVFFSGSVKSFIDLPFWYPANYLKYFNGSDVPPSANVSAYMTMGMSGVVSHQEYEKMVNQTHFGVATPLDFPGYNNNAGSLQSMFAFWSSEAFTYSTAFQALSWFDNIS